MTPLCPHCRGSEKNHMPGCPGARKTTIELPFSPEDVAAGTVKRSSFESELESLINKFSMESGSNTPDFILAEYMSQCLKIFNAAVCAREMWYGRDGYNAAALRDETDTPPTPATVQRAT